MAFVTEYCICHITTRTLARHKLFKLLHVPHVIPQTFRHLVFSYNYWNSIHCRHKMKPAPPLSPKCSHISLKHIFFITVKDDRLRCVKELVYAEEVYNDCLKSLVELYAEPLRYASHKCNTKAEFSEFQLNFGVDRMQSFCANINAQNRRPIFL